VDRWYYTAIVHAKQADSFSFLHFSDECFSLFNFLFAVSCNSLPIFTKKQCFLMELANSSVLTGFRRHSGILSYTTALFSFIIGWKTDFFRRADEILRRSL
ncbi:MAG: hypothetical protein ACLTBF_00230, partial [Christensenellales bacterium]